MRRIAARAAPTALRTALRRRLAAPVFVLLYHRVRPRIVQDVHHLAVTAEHFAGHLAWLARRAALIDQAEFLDFLAQPTRAAKPRVLITFDDGYADNVAHALPILQSSGRSAVLFVTSGAIGSNELFWWDAVERIVAASLAAGAPTPEDVTLADDTRLSWGGDEAERCARLRAALKAARPEQRRAILARLAERWGVSLGAGEDDRPVNQGELQAWLAARMAVGAHTCTHAQLSAASKHEIERELTGSKRALEHSLGAPVQMLSYPFGRREDFDERAEQAAHAAGYRCAFANWEGNCRWARSRYALPRFLVRNWPVGGFAAHFQAWCRAYG